LGFTYDYGFRSVITGPAYIAWFPDKLAKAFFFHITRGKRGDRLYRNSL